MSYDSSLRIRRFFSRFAGPVDNFGEQALFYGESMRYIPNALTRYRKETIRLIAEMTMGTGALVLIGGTVGVAAFLTLASGGVIAVQGYESLGNIGIEALTGFLSAFLNVRIVAPVVAGIALAATIGAGTTAQLGAMRVAEEIDAIESMAVHSVSYLVSTRLIAGLIAIVPLYSLAVLASFFAARFTTGVMTAAAVRPREIPIFALFRLGAENYSSAPAATPPIQRFWGCASASASRNDRAQRSTS
jgi:phospholipid/cholesterol/gamma-HCH transport system permease protein